MPRTPVTLTAARVSWYPSETVFVVTDRMKTADLITSRPPEMRLRWRQAHWRPTEAYVTRGLQPGFIRDPLTRLTIRGALLAGFLAILVLWLAWAYYLSHGLPVMERQTSTIHARFDQSDEALLTIAAQVLLGSVYLRDAFVDTRPDADRLYRAEVQNARTQIDRALMRYVPDVDATLERDHWARLRVELQEYWDATMPVLSAGPSRNPAQALAMLNDQVIPKRRTIIEISEQLRTLNKDAIQREEAAIALLYRDLRRRAWR